MRNDGPSYIELRARSDCRDDEADLLAFVAWLLAKVGFESHPCETHPPAREVILPANWRELPVVAAAINDADRERDRGRFGDNETRGNDSVRSDLVDLPLELRAEKPLSVAVTDPAKPSAAWIWLPKSQIEFERKGANMVIVTLPEWLGKQKGLV